jgi:hypothetical protein
VAPKLEFGFEGAPGLEQRRRGERSARARR